MKKSKLQMFGKEALSRNELRNVGGGLVQPGDGGGLGDCKSECSSDMDCGYYAGHIERCSASYCYGSNGAVLVGYCN